MDVLLVVDILLCVWCSIVLIDRLLFVYCLLSLSMCLVCVLLVMLEVVVSVLMLKLVNVGDWYLIE